jgi:SUMO ligase MMS21 Smc5/6 complex component
MFGNNTPTYKYAIQEQTNVSLLTNTSNNNTTQVMPTLRKIEVSQQTQDQVDPVLTSLEALISESFTCLICAGPCRETIVLPTCNHRFCNICINEYLRYEHVCPYNNCDAQIPTSGSLRRDPQFDQIVSNNSTQAFA